ncbi:MAG: hypothetical protein FD152_1270 [Xanthobacteraceae bacterium]|nr:MAG: hypothetical protein FD152_1270 [Xanthobacteraceae bacterium]
MPIVDIATALVTEPPLMALVVFAGIAFAALATAAVIHALRITVFGKDCTHARH